MTDKTLGQIAYEADYLNTMSPGWPWEKISLKSRYAYEHIAQVVAAHVSDKTAIETQLMIQVEKMLCEKLNIAWGPTGMSVTSLVDRLASHTTQAVAAHVRATDASAVELTKMVTPYISQEHFDRVFPDTFNPPEPAKMCELAGAKFPIPLLEAPKNGAIVWFGELCGSVYMRFWDNTENQRSLLDAGQLYLTQGGAEQQSDAVRAVLAKAIKEAV